MFSLEQRGLMHVYFFKYLKGCQNEKRGLAKEATFLKQF